MFKVYFLLHADNDPFKAHGDEAAALARETFPNLAGYVQTRASERQVDGREGGTAFNATAEVWFRYAADAVQAAQHGCDALINGAEVHAVHCGEERVVMRTAEHWLKPCMKGVYPFRRKAGMGIADFQHYWWHNHGPIAAATEEALCYVQTHVLEQYYEGGEPAYDGVTELHWLDTGAANRAVASRQMVEDQGGDAPNFVDLESVQLLLVDQEICVAP